MSRAGGLKTCDEANGDVAITHATGTRSQADFIARILFEILF
jgi:hypothetical protein